jgi:hypothetical protein
MRATLGAPSLNPNAWGVAWGRWAVLNLGRRLAAGFLSLKIGKNPHTHTLLLTHSGSGTTLGIRAEELGSAEGDPAAIRAFLLL